MDGGEAGAKEGEAGEGADADAEEAAKHPSIVKNNGAAAAGDAAAATEGEKGTQEEKEGLNKE